MTKTPYAYRLDFHNHDSVTVDCESLQEARAACTAVMEGEYTGFPHRPKAVTMLVRDSGELRAVWRSDL